MQDTTARKCGMKMRHEAHDWQHLTEDAGWITVTCSGAGADTTIHLRHSEAGAEALCYANSTELSTDRARVTCAECRAIVAKRQILDDMNSGVLPATLPATFSDLHDYVDANEYGGLCDDMFAGDFTGDDGEPTEAFWDMAGAVQDVVDGWLRTLAANRTAAVR